jgi:hypothetical protein
MTNPSDNPGSPGPGGENPELSPQVTELLGKTREILERAREPSVETLREFADLELQPDQAYACFELFHWQDYGMNYNEFFVEKGTLSTDYNPLHDSEDSFLPELNDFVRGYFADKPDRLGQVGSTQFIKLHEAQLFKWFSECWIAAGGDKSQVLTYFAFEKEYAVRDLVTGEVMSEAEVAKRLGFDIVE